MFPFIFKKKKGLAFPYNHGKIIATDLTEKEKFYKESLQLKLSRDVFRGEKLQSLWNYADSLISEKIKGTVEEINALERPLKEFL